MLALGRRPMPKSILLGGIIYGHQETVKHDFWAATAFYQDENGSRVVLKLARTTDFFSLPMAWCGRFLCQREARFYRKLADSPNVPRLLGTVGRTGLVHEFVPGQSLANAGRIPDGFFAALQRLMSDIHRRGMAYVDTNKSYNIIVGDDGRPYLIDFQISWNLADLGNSFLNRWWLSRLQRADRYHLLKHKRRLRPDEITRDEMEVVTRPTALIRLHRFLTKPYFRLRRSMFRRLRQAGYLMPETSG